jgi:hypothetical protein
MIDDTRLCLVNLWIKVSYHNFCFRMLFNLISLWIILPVNYQLIELGESRVSLQVK